MNNLEKATFAGGCFWCTETVFSSLKGVESVTSGYIGGTSTNPSYKEVCTGTTGHAEAVEIVFNPDMISYNELLEIFFATHNPTTLNRQGGDIGTQYRSEIFYHNEEQKKQAEDFIALMASEEIFEDPIVTQISEATTFYTAEDYHRDYFNQNPNQPYCQSVITPKVKKFKETFIRKLKK